MILHKNNNNQGAFLELLVAANNLNINMENEMITLKIRENILDILTT